MTTTRIFTLRLVRREEELSYFDWEVAQNVGSITLQVRELPLEVPA